MDQQENNEIQIKYKQISQFYQEEFCTAFAFNQDNTILVASANSNIRVFDFNKGLIVEKQVLSQIGLVGTLYFMKTQNKFISTCLDSVIVIWEQENNKNWKCCQVIKNVDSWAIELIIMNKTESQMFSCGMGLGITVWKFGDTLETAQILEAQKQVYSISLNDDQNELISCGQDPYIVIHYYSNIWRKKQIIQLDCDGCRVCSINNNLIAFQPSKGKYLQLFSLQQSTGFYVSLSQIPIQNVSDCRFNFQISYNKTSQILLIKNGEFIYFVKVLPFGKMKILQKYVFPTILVFGALTNDWQYFVTWDITTEMIQIRERKTN